VNPGAQYLLSVHGPAESTESGTNPPFNERLHRDGHFVFAGALEPATTATTVDGQGVTDDPVAALDVGLASYFDLKK
jgi:hypothetical protein